VGASVEQLIKVDNATGASTSQRRIEFRLSFTKLFFSFMMPMDSYLVYLTAYARVWLECDERSGNSLLARRGRTRQREPLRLTFVYECDTSTVDGVEFPTYHLVT
ncbi:MAG: hypothetical protein ACI9B9_002461, partial [Halioglobus sp.]